MTKEKVLNHRILLCNLLFIIQTKLKPENQLIIQYEESVSI